MLKISTEFRKGVLFVRLVGRIDNEGYLEKINNIIDQMGIQCIVLNLNNLNDVSLDSIDHIIKYNNEILKKNKQLLICDANNIRNRLFKKIIPNIISEIEAFSLI
ncbi:MAG: STAS domain-containing protein [Erysipelotrichaceae bacterium]|nr:STAS domain-containing protein [Erysipelotrichaceae bacterium]